MPPTFRATQQPVIQSTQTSSDPCQSSSVNAFCLCPVCDDSSVGRFCPWPGKQIIRFFLEWPRQKPEILFVAIALSFHQKVLKRFQQDEAEIDVEYYVAISIFISHFNKREN
jgi:hypothetical protein